MTDSTHVAGDQGFRDVRITCDDGCAIGTSITVDGEPLTDVSRVDWSVSVGEAATATLYCHFTHLDARAKGVFVPAKGTPLSVRLRLAWLMVRGR